MENANFTQRAMKAIESARDIARGKQNTMVEAEHLFYAILKEPTIVEKILPKAELDKIKDALYNVICTYPRTSDINYMPQISGSFTRILSTAMKAARDSYISIPLLLQTLINDTNIAKIIKNSSKLFSKLKEEIDKVVSSNKYYDINSDDPSDKMTKFAVDMVALARQNKYDPVIGRDDEIRQVLEILGKKSKGNAIMVGKPGVGKTAIVTGIAQHIAKSGSNKNYKLYNVDMGAMVAGACHRGDFEKRLKELIKEAEEDENVILFIDEIHTVLGAGKTDGSMDAANILKPGLADGTLKIIGATTYDEYRKYVSKDPAFERRFTRVNVREQSIEDTITVMRGLRERMEMHHGVRISDQALVYASQIGKRYIANRRLPDLAIDLVDTACAAAVLSLNSEPAEICSMKSKLWSLELEKTSLEIDIDRYCKNGSGNSGEENNNYTNNYNPHLLDELNRKLDIVRNKVANLNNELNTMIEKYNIEKGHIKEAKELQIRLEDARNRMENAMRDGNKYLAFDLQSNVIPTYEKKLKELQNKVEVVDAHNIAEMISRLSGIPIQRLSVRENDRLMNMEERINSHIFGQEAAVKTVVESVLAAKAGLADPNRPIGSFLFLGPTGVGKTELAKALCTELNGTCENMVVLDMSDYSTEISITKLLGAPAGYVGCEDGGSLTEPIKEMPYNVVLLDEVDLAHQSILNVLYQLLDEGRVTDGRGNKVSFRNTVVILTTNLGCQHIIKDGNTNYTAIESQIINKFGQPLVNRIGNTVIFNHLSENALLKIFNFEINELNKKLADKKISFVVSEAVQNYAVTQAKESVFGARILKRFVKDNFYNFITKIILSNNNLDSKDITCFLESENVVGENHGIYTYVVN